jgi:outer membrane autotransporter protein
VASWGALYAAGVLSYSRFDNEVTRTIAGLGPPETTTGRLASDLFGARLELGHSYALPWLNVTPFAAVQSATLWQRGFTETTLARTHGQAAVWVAANSVGPLYTPTVSAWITSGRDEAPIARGVWLEATLAKKSPAGAGLK